MGSRFIGQWFLTGPFFFGGGFCRGINFDALVVMSWCLLKRLLSVLEILLCSFVDPYVMISTGIPFDTFPLDIALAAFVTSVDDIGRLSGRGGPMNLWKSS